MSEPLLEAIDVRKTFRLGGRPLEVLRNVTVTVARSDFVALQGASGAGKTTLLHLLVGLDTSSAGTIRFAGQNLAQLSNAALARWRNTKVGLVFQAYHLFPELSALENVALPARMARVAPHQAAERARVLLQRVGLGQRLEHRPAELSGGEQQRVAIARALVNAPELLLADEPTGNLDSHTGDEIIDLLCALRAERQTTLLIATHDSRVAARAPKVVELVDGQLQERSFVLSQEYPGTTTGGVLGTAPSPS
jgi:predicted ABC-type transport system involved in lysophospholipase L1 biosynthesis ATPase subunit